MDFDLYLVLDGVIRVDRDGAQLLARAIPHKGVICL